MELHRLGKKEVDKNTQIKDPYQLYGQNKKDNSWFGSYDVLHI